MQYVRRTKFGFSVKIRNFISFQSAKVLNLEGPGIKSWYGRDFSRPFIPNLGPTQPPVQWETSLFPAAKTSRAWPWPPTHI